MRSLLALALLAACSASDSQPAGPAEPIPPAASAESAVPAPNSPPRDPATPASDADPPLDLDALLPPGEGWKCVHGRCDRGCVYPRPTHAPGPDGRVVTLSNNPPCTDAGKAFCAAFAASPGNRPAARCWATREACEADRNNASLATTACEER